MNEKLNVETNKFECSENDIKVTATDRYLDWKVTESKIKMGFNAVVVTVAGSGTIILVAKCFTEIKQVFGL